MYIASNATRKVLEQEKIFSSFQALSLMIVSLAMKTPTAETLPALAISAMRSLRGRPLQDKPVSIITVVPISNYAVNTKI